MARGTLPMIVMLLVALTGCPGGDGGVGDPCDRHSDCSSTLQCAQSTCVPRCQRAPECGDGYDCDSDGICVLAAGQAGDRCTSEVECAPGLFCQIDGMVIDNITGRLLASCAETKTGRPAGAECTADDDCQNRTCALGHCVDLCDETRDCGAGNSCMVIPRVEAGGALFGGCFQSQGTVSWSIPMQGPTADILLPVPSGAQHASLVMTVEDQAQSVGALSLFSPAGLRLYRPCKAIDVTECNADDQLEQYYANPVRHRPEVAESVLAMPSSPNVMLETGAYRVNVSSFRPGGSTGSAIPNLKAVVRIDSAVILDLHFHFLDLEDHPCEFAFNGAKLDKTAAQTETYFQSDFLGHLRTIFANGGIALGAISYQDILDHSDLDGLDIIDTGSLLSLGSHAQGINVFFVRTLSPVGIQAYGPGPGPAGLANTRRSGIVVGMDTVCFREWEVLARLTAYEIARYMGLYHNIEVGATSTNNLRDAITDSNDSPANLMFYSERGGTELSPGQRDILTRSPVLR